MGHSIQEIFKKINSSLSWTDCVSLLCTAGLLVVAAAILSSKNMASRLPVAYEKASQEAIVENGADARPFGSVFGTTYTFSWCGGASVIRDKNKVYFATPEDAERVGRSLSKLCQK